MPFWFEYSGDRYSLTCPRCGAKIGEGLADIYLQWFKKHSGDFRKAANPEPLGEDKVNQQVRVEAANPEPLGEDKVNQQVRVEANGGHVYILINAAMPGLVKVGKTQREPEERARELSCGTGVPTPHYVAFTEWFIDCSAGEEFVHSYLTAKGYRLVGNREFFCVPLKDAIKVIMQAKAREEKANGQNSDKGSVE